MDLQFEMSSSWPRWKFHWSLSSFVSWARSSASPFPIYVVQTDGQVFQLANKSASHPAVNEKLWKQNRHRHDNQQWFQNVGWNRVDVNAEDEGENCEVAQKFNYIKFWTFFRHDWASSVDSIIFFSCLETLIFRTLSFFEKFTRIWFNSRTNSFDTATRKHAWLIKTRVTKR